MHKLLRTYIVALHAAAMAMVMFPAFAWAGSMMLLGAGAPSAAAVTFALAFTDTKDDTGGGTTVNYGSASIGAADPNRVVPVVIMGRLGTPTTVTGVKIGGDAVCSGGTSASQASGAAGTVAGILLSDIWYASVPTGTTANICITYGSLTLESEIAVYRIITSTPTPTAASGTSSSSATSLNRSIAIPAGGGLIGGLGIGGCGVATTWTSTGTAPTRDLNTVSGCSGRALSAASDTANAGSSPTTTAMWGSSATSLAMSVAAWKP